MLTDSGRFAFTARRHHAFASTGNAYDAVQCDEAIGTGETLVVLAEEVVGVASPNPFAVTQAHGNLHPVSAPREGEALADLARSLHVNAAHFEHAAKIARRFGFPLDPQIEALAARPAG